MIYLDYNAQAPLLPCAQQAMTKALLQVGNPSSIHGYGRQARKILENARRSIATNIGAQDAEVIFTSGATEANNQVLQTFIESQISIAISAIEHDSVGQFNSHAHIVPVSDQGILNLKALDQWLQSVPMGQQKAISIVLANNETGVIQPIREIVERVHQHGGYVHVDATQAVGRMDVNFKAMDLDYMTFSSHKIGGPVGAGALIVKQGCALTPLILGGGQEKNRRSGTPNMPAIAGFAAALQEMTAFNWSSIEIMRNQLERDLPDGQILSGQVNRLANTLCVRMPGVSSDLQIMAFDLESIAVSAGSACSSGKVQASKTLQAMGFSVTDASQSIRISLCPNTLQDDLAKFVNVWYKIYNQHCN